jgi:hypothetical protein
VDRSTGARATVLTQAAALARPLVVAAVAASALLWAGASSAAPNTYTVLAFGNLSCGNYLSHRQSEADGDLISDAMFAWLMGYLTAYNDYGPGDGNITGNTDSSGVQAWLDSYCQAHPLDRLVAAAQALVAELKSRKR